MRTNADAETLVAWVREAADELEKAHVILDAIGVPRSVPGREPVACSLAARISILAEERNDLGVRLDAASGVLLLVAGALQALDADDRQAQEALTMFDAWQLRQLRQEEGS